MDRTETYIQMSDCEEIQTEHEYADGDLYSEKCHYQDGVTAIFNEFYCSDCDRELKLDRTKWIWLPLQHQLQEMLFESTKSKGYILVTYFVDMMRKGCLDKSQVDLTSMEQLWLAFVMKEKFNKIWDGKEWQISKNLD